MSTGDILVFVSLGLGLTATIVAVLYFSGRCPNCKQYRAAKNIYSETIQKAANTGFEKIQNTYQCKHCDHEWKEIEVIYPVHWMGTIVL